MYCEKCGTEMKVTDKFCEKCGNKNLNITNKPKAKESNITGSVNPSTIVTPPTTNKIKFIAKNLIKLILIIIVIIIIGNVLNGLVSDEYKETSISSKVSNEYINIVKNASPARFPNATFGEAFDGYLGDVKWEHGVTDNDENFVNITGKSIYFRSTINVMIQYVVYDNGTIELNYCEMMDGNIDIADYIILGTLYDNAFKNAYSKNGYTLPVDYAVEVANYAMANINMNSDQVQIDIFHKSFDPIGDGCAVVEETKQLITYNTNNKEFEVNWPDSDPGDTMDGEYAEYIITRDAGLYSSMSTSDLIMTIPAGMKVNVTDDCGDGWYYAIYNNKDGFIESSKIIPLNDYHNRETTTEVAIGYGQFILPESSTRAITDTELSALTSEQLRLAINEIYARHGRIFKDSELNAWFSSKSWYNGTITVENFNESVLSQVEKDNVAKLSAARDNKQGSKFTSGWVYGEYELKGNGYSAIATIEYASGDDIDYISLSGCTDDGLYAGGFDGSFEVMREGGYLCTVYDEYGDWIVLEYNGIDRIDILDASGNFGGMRFPGFEGSYKKTREFQGS